jgi:hypothetical protein
MSSRGRFRMSLDRFSLGAPSVGNNMSVRGVLKEADLRYACGISLLGALIANALATTPTLAITCTDRR